jgi:hypothetical protein
MARWNILEHVGILSERTYRHPHLAGPLANRFRAIQTLAECPDSTSEGLMINGK